MTCPTCKAKLSDTAKFCDQCGTRKPLDGDKDVALEILRPWIGDGFFNTFDVMNARAQQDALAMLAKAREVLGVDAKDAEIARLKEQATEMARRLSWALGLQTKGGAVDYTVEELENAANATMADYRNVMGAARTSAANARREALEEVEGAWATYGRSDFEGWLADTITSMRQRDASQPAAETPTCSEPGCGQCACQSSRVQPSAETQTPKLFVGVDRGSPNGDQSALVEMEQQPDGSMLVTRSLQGKEAEAEIARREQPPARDVDGLARIFRETIDRARGEVLATDDVIAMLCARAAIAHLYGGPRT